MFDGAREGAAAPLGRQTEGAGSGRALPSCRRSLRKELSAPPGGLRLHPLCFPSFFPAKEAGAGLQHPQGREQALQGGRGVSSVCLLWVLL